MINIVVIFDDPELNGEPFNKNEYKVAYREMSEVAQLKSANLIFARGEKSYLGDGIFQNCSQYIDGSLSELSSPIKADVVYDKSINFKPDNSVTTINDRYLKELCNDKYETYKLFPDISPKTYLANNEKELNKVIENYNQDMIVVKSVVGSGGKQVFIGDKEKAINESHEFPVIIQEYQDTSVGIEGIVEGMHDIRIILFNEEVFFSYIRIPAQGSHKAGVSSGGTLVYLDRDKLPVEVVSLAKEIDSYFSNIYPRFYSIDFMNTKNGFKLVELNSQPSVWARSRHPTIQNYQERLIEMLISISGKNDNGIIQF